MKKLKNQITQQHYNSNNTEKTLKFNNNEGKEREREREERTRRRGRREVTQKWNIIKVQPKKESYSCESE